MRKYYWYGEYEFDLDNRIFKNKQQYEFKHSVYQGKYKPVFPNPVGVWLCPNKQWYRYCVYHRIKEWIKYRCIFSIDDTNPSILKLTSNDEIKSFMDKYLIDSEEYLWNKRFVESINPSKEMMKDFELNWEGLKKRIDWTKVFNDYKGYFISKKMDKKYFKNTHNVDTLFIWDSTLL